MWTIAVYDFNFCLIGRVRNEPEYIDLNTCRYFQEKQWILNSKKIRAQWTQSVRVYGVKFTLVYCRRGHYFICHIWIIRFFTKWNKWVWDSHGQLTLQSKCTVHMHRMKLAYLLLWNTYLIKIPTDVRARFDINWPCSHLTHICISIDFWRTSIIYLYIN